MITSSIKPGMLITDWFVGLRRFKEFLQNIKDWKDFKLKKTHKIHIRDTLFIYLELTNKVISNLNRHNGLTGTLINVKFSNVIYSFTNTQNIQDSSIQHGQHQRIDRSRPKDRHSLPNMRYHPIRSLPDSCRVSPYRQDERYHHINKNHHYTLILFNLLKMIASLTTLMMVSIIMHLVIPMMIIKILSFHQMHEVMKPRMLLGSGCNKFLQQNPHIYSTKVCYCKMTMKERWQ